jgi:hypothetical protein
MVEGLIISQLLYHRKETWYLEYKRLGGPQGYSGHVWTISPTWGMGSGTRKILLELYRRWKMTDRIGTWITRRLVVMVNDDPCMQI